ncbi:MAG: GH39 family glycosyl hydrolase, partial [Thermoleophilaceae bacterium]
LDTLVATAERHGVELLLTVTDSPCWASSAPESLKQGCEGSWWSRDVQRYPPTNARDYADALAFLVGRYGDRIAAWEVWNEPNLSYYFRADNPAADYAKIVRAAYPAAKAARPSATVIVGALAEAPAAFVEQLFEHGIGGHFDAFSVHPYSGDASPLSPQSDEWIQTSFTRGVPSVREVLLRHGEDKPIWLTEFGWSTSTIRGAEVWRNGVSEQVQALYTEQALVKVRDWPYVPVALVYGLKDVGTDPTDRNDNFGLIRYDGSPKPAYAAFQRGAEVLSGLREPPVEPEVPGDDVAVDEDVADEGVAVEQAVSAELDDTGDVVVSSTRRMRLSLTRAGERIYVRGDAEPRTVVRLRAHRYLRAERRFSRRARFTDEVRVSGSGRFVRRLDARLGRGRWRVTASYAELPEEARAQVTLKGGRHA